MAVRHEKLLPLALLIMINIFWGSSYTFTKIALQELSPGALVLLRYGVASIFFLGMILPSKEGDSISLRTIPRLIVLGFFGFAASPLLNNIGVHYSRAMDASIIIVLEVVFTTALGALWLKEPWHTRKTFALLLGIAGVFLLSGFSWEGRLSDSSHLIGNLLIMLSLVFEVVYTILGKKTVEDRSPLAVTGYSVLIGAILLAPFFGSQLAPSSLVTLSFKTWMAVLYLSLICTVVCYSIWFLMLSRMEAGNVAISLYVQPLTGTLLAVLALGEKIIFSTLIGAGAILLSVMIAVAKEPVKSSLSEL